MIYRAKNGKECLKLLKKAKKNDTIIWDEATPVKYIRELFIKK